MTQAEAKTRLRNFVNESATGFYTDTQLYAFLDSGVRQAIVLILAKLQNKRRENRYARSAMLEPLHTLDTLNTTTTTTAGVRVEYNLPSDYLMTEYCELDVDDRDAEGKYPCVLIDYSLYKHNDQNSFLQFTYTAPAYYIRADKIGFCVDILHGSANMYSHYYYKTPSAVAGSGDLPLRVEAHEAILRFALADALIMDDRSQEAEMHKTWATEMINQLD